ncbi:unnamed protein product [Brassica oleracea]
MWICLFTIRVCDFFFVHSDNDCGCINIDEGVPVIGMVLVYMFCDTGISNSQDIVPETLPEEALSKMSTPPKSESPIITPDELTEADGRLWIPNTVRHDGCSVQSLLGHYRWTPENSVTCW